MIDLQLPSNIDIDRYVDPPADSHRIISGAKVAEMVVAAGKRENHGAKLPWSKTHNRWRFAGGQISIWAAAQSSFKSSLLGQTMIGFVEQGEKVCVASLEEPLANYGRRLARQMWARNDVADDDIRRALSTVGDRYLFWDVHGEMSADRAVAMMRYVAFEHGVTQFVFDNVSDVIDPGNDNATEQWKFVKSAVRLARDTCIDGVGGMHIHLVMHTRKAGTDLRKPRRPCIDDIRGSGTAAQLVDNVLMPWRNLEKEQAIEEAGSVKVEDVDYSRQPDCTLLVEKFKFARAGFDRGAIGLWKYPDAWRFQQAGDPEPTPSTLIGS